VVAVVLQGHDRYAFPSHPGLKFALKKNLEKIPILGWSSRMVRMTDVDGEPASDEAMGT
jgi:1-acyl-sn-glycerol-3-phosphate acyltransferase